jgi:5-methylcytosine-specific restriction enzyme subunit McrC
MDVMYCVLDTKYKSKGHPDAKDVAQVMAYAEMKNCGEAVLIYPIPLNFPEIKSDGRIHVKGMTFSLDGDLEEAGQHFLHSLSKSGIICDAGAEAGCDI